MRQLLVVLCFFLSLPSAAAADGQGPEEKITAAATTWSALYAKRDLEALMRLYHADASLFTNGQPALVGRETIRAYFAKNFETTKGGTIDFKIESVDVFDDVANMVSLYKMQLDIGRDAPLVLAGRSMLIYKRDAFGNWLLFADMDNLAPDATADAFDAAK